MGGGGRVESHLEMVRSFPNKRIQKVCFEMSKHLGIYTL